MSRMDGITPVPRLWPGETFVCIGGGPSLTKEDVVFCHGKARVIAINDAYRLAPWADVLYAADARWWMWHKGCRDFAGLKFSVRNSPVKGANVHQLVTTGEAGLELDPRGLRTGRNSGYQAINLAVHLGAARILLLGYDMHVGKGGREHWFGDHPNQSKSPYGMFRDRFRAIADPLQRLGIEVVNCSRETKLPVFRRMPLMDALMPVEAVA